MNESFKGKIASPNYVNRERLCSAKSMIPSNPEDQSIADCQGQRPGHPMLRPTETARRGCYSVHSDKLNAV